MQESASAASGKTDSGAVHLLQRRSALTQLCIGSLLKAAKQSGILNPRRLAVLNLPGAVQDIHAPNPIPAYLKP